MRSFKPIDFWIQIILIVMSTLWALTVGDFRFIWSYILVGSVQVISALIHLICSGHYIPQKSRKFYGMVVLVLALLSTFLFNSRQGIEFGVVMLVVSPFLAAWYAWICYEEIKISENPSNKKSSSSDFYEM
ncbi:hypothetical protein LZZ85_19340 [Terrimonas sp. NA20]|uniref:Uncharacterized protein n=1 Tax=Terrimonas ginsenosidimutans TaxID=2908004 RepID=A0ABS9KVX8_9BACT|nr:hypothetical protein [Terrimonas ginsenosidimutans]MCG2616463.1 hypothetical protein [Terrimonas ginsenosidimutans]